MWYDIFEEIWIFFRKYLFDGKVMRKVYDMLFEINVDESILVVVIN